MIYTVTFNPAVDYVMKLDALKPGATNRSCFEEIFFGGKGINVSHVLKELGMETTALGFCAGFTGDAIVKSLEERGISADFVRLSKGSSRINVKVKADVETEINGQGPEISETEIRQLFDKLSVLENGDTMILAGSIPNTLPESIYEDMMQKLSDRRVRFVVDATKDLLLNVLKHKPFLIKPNVSELEEIFGFQMEQEEQIIHCAKDLQERGAMNVLVSMGADGAILLDEKKDIHKIKGISGKVVNTVGAGDSMVAGFVAGFIKSGSYSYALRLGMAAGTATAFSMDLASGDKIDQIMKCM